MPGSAAELRGAAMHRRRRSLRALLALWAGTICAGYAAGQVTLTAV